MAPQTLSALRTTHGFTSSASSSQRPTTTRACVPPRRRGYCPPSPWSLLSCSPAPLPPRLPLLSPAKPAPFSGSRRRAASECGCVRRHRCKFLTFLIILLRDLFSLEKYPTSRWEFYVFQLQLCCCQFGSVCLDCTVYIHGYVQSTIIHVNVPELACR